ncbi:hypothetical protein PHMEG_00022724 [Phytophthora megakarya]|uniref:Uncharacterized protein n=1 Tax=Phytophthora megakarya TaxID=4795 RepID=A0A225VKD6_9STRA|nr:hypothetical protein PHMEG_00022724 [Phytophthora megakarya]
MDSKSRVILARNAKMSEYNGVRSVNLGAGCAVYLELLHPGPVPLATWYTSLASSFAFGSI